MLRFAFVIVIALFVSVSSVNAQTSPDSSMMRDPYEWGPDKWSLYLGIGPSKRDKECNWDTKGFAVETEFEKRKWKNVYFFANLYGGKNWTDKQSIYWTARAKGNLLDKDIPSVKILRTEDLWQTGLVAGVSGDLINLPRYRMNLGVGVGAAYYNYPNTTVEYSQNRSDTQYRVLVNYSAPNLLSPTWTLRALIDYKLSEHWALTLIGRLRFYRQHFDVTSGEMRDRFGGVVDFVEMPKSGVIPYAGIGIRWVY